MIRAGMEKAAASALYHLGLFAPFQRLALNVAHRKDAAGRTAFQILNYHRVDPHFDPFLLHPVAPAQFESQIRFLSRHYRILPLGELLTRSAEGSLPANCVAITFDDGYKDNYLHAFPILKQHRVPATLFVATGCIEQQSPLWYDRVFHAFKHTRKAVLPLAHWGLEDFAMGAPAARLAFLGRVMDHLRAVPNGERVALLAELFALLEVTDFSALAGFMLDWDQVRELDRNGFDVQAHTVTHPILSRVTGPELDSEIAESRRMLEDRLGKKIDLFAYPNGKAEDFNAETIAALKRNGFRAAVTTVFGKNRAGDDPFVLKRATPWLHEIPSYAMCQLKIDLGG